MTDQLPLGDETLDSMLQDWSQHQAVDADRLTRLHARIRNDVVVSRPERRPGRSAVSVVCAVAACLVAAVTIGLIVPQRSGISMAVVEPRVKLNDLWKKTSQVFGPDLKWICDLDGKLLLGVSGDDAAAENGNRLYVLLTVREFDSARHKWIDAWTGRIACQGGAPVDFASDDHRMNGSVWVQSRPDGQFAVSHWLSWQEHPELSGPIEAVFNGDEKVVADRKFQGRHVQVVQQIWRGDVG